MVTKAGVAVGHAPNKILVHPVHFFILNGGVILCEATDPIRRYLRNLPQGGLEIPCIFKLQDNKQLIDKLKKLLAISKKYNEKEGTTKMVDLPLSLNYSEAKQIKVEEVLPSVPEASRSK